MKTLSKNLLATAITTLFIAPAAFATNGTNMTGVSAVSSALGGTGTAAYFGAANVIINPAMIGKGDGTIIGFGGTLFKPSVSNDGSTGGTKYSSSADTFMIPSVAISSRINNNWSFGIGMFGTSGMGVDYSNYSNTNPATAGLVKAQSTLQIMRIVPTIAYNSGNFGVGFSPIVQYGALDVNYDTFNGMTPMTFGKGMSSDLGMGYTLGGYFDVSKQFTLGAAYTSAINMKYKNQLNGQTGAASNFGLTNITDQLEQPAEIKVGAAYTMGNIMMTGDLKQIRWGDAKGYKDFGWKDQNVLALGVRYTQPSYWLGIGYNKADNPIPNLAIGMTPQGMANANINMFNNIFFPATTEQHFSFGGGYVLTKNVGIDAAVVYAPEVNSTVDVLTPGGAAKNTTSHSQIGYTVSVRYKF